MLDRRGGGRVPPVPECDGRAAELDPSLDALGNRLASAIDDAHRVSTQGPTARHEQKGVRLVWGGGTPQIVDTHLGHLSDSDRAKVKGGNLARLLGFL